MRLIFLVFAVLVFLCLSVNVDAQECSAMPDELSATIQSFSIKGEMLKVTVSVSNHSESPAYISKTSYLPDGKKGPYVSLDDGILYLESRVFKASLYPPYADHSGVELEVISPGKSSYFSWDLKLPVFETSPPGDIQNRKIYLQTIKLVKIRIGYFDERITHEASVKLKSRPRLSGSDFLNFNSNDRRTVLDVQKLACTQQMVNAK